MSSNVMLEMPSEMAHAIVVLLQNSLGEDNGKNQLNGGAEQEIIDQIAASGLKLQQYNQAMERAQQEIGRLAATTQATLTRLEEKFGC